MKPIFITICLGLVVFSSVFCISPLAIAAQSPDIKMDQLWEDTATTKDLPHVWRIYRRRQFPNRLHEQLRLYMIQPKDWQSTDQRPVIVFIHGGGWSNGNPDQWFPQCRYFAQRGLVTASIQYRLRTKSVDIDESLADCKSAVRYMRQHCTELGIDPHRIVVVGESAGGHLAGAVGTIDDFNHPEDDLSYSSLPDAMVLLNPITDLSTNWGKSLGDKAIALSPLHHVSKKTPPTLLIHGNVDQCVDIEHSKAFYKKMNELGRPCQLIIFEGANHAFAVFKYGPDKFVKRAITEIDNYLVNLGWLSGR